MASGKATGFWKKGIFCVRLNVELTQRNLQPVACGVDPGSKREGYTVKSKAYHYLNIQATAVGGSVPENKDLPIVVPIGFHRRQLHRLEHTPGHIRSPYGGTMSAGFKRGSLVKHPKWGLTYSCAS